MQVFIAGATGVLGRRLTRELTRRGHAVVGLARTDLKAAIVRREGGRPVRANLFDADELARVAAGSEVVIHAATSIPIGPEARSRKSWEANDSIRRAGTAALTTAAGRIGARRYLQQSVAWVVRRTPVDPPFDEDTPPDPPKLLQSAVDGESIARAAGGRYGFSVGIVRCGSFYGSDTGHTLGMAAMLRRRRLPIIGSGDWLIAPIHVDDAATAFAAAAESDQPGTWHIVDDRAIPFATFLSDFARALGAPSPRRIPLWVAKLLVGSDVVESLTTSMNTSNRRAKSELGWTLRYPDFRQGLDQVLATWHEEAAA